MGNGLKTGGGEPVMSQNEGHIAARRGRRPGGQSGREQILAAAASQFGENGYQATTIRNIAKDAGVDTKLVHYYFGTKEELFGAAIASIFHARGFPDLLLATASAGVRSPGTQYLLAVLNTLEDPRIGPTFIGLVRGLGTHEESRRIFLRFIQTEMLERLAPRLTNDHPETRVSLAGTQILGLVLGRYVLKIPPMTDLTIDQAAHLVGPNIDRYITGTLDWDRPEDNRIATN